MQAQDRRLMDLIQGTRQYRVPICQRPYEWDDKRWATLWDDLIKTKSRRQAQRQLAQDQQYRHFFASIVIRELGGIPVTIIDLIDGQQRLITFMLLIKALIDECAESHLSETTQSRLLELIMNPDYVRNKMQGHFPYLFYKIMSYTERGDAIRIISARPATMSERERHEN